MKEPLDPFPLMRMCQALKLSRSGDSAWGQRGDSRHTQQDQSLSEQIRQIHESSRGIYGAPRIHATLKGQGARTARKRVARLMRPQGIWGRHKRRFQRTTPSQHAFPVA
ncbi:MAG: transposase [Armatimonadetes bacterium]|nr:transposase [Armatimonadota bacterium]